MKANLFIAVMPWFIVIGFFLFVMLGVWVLAVVVDSILKITRGILYLKQKILDKRLLGGIFMEQVNLNETNEMEVLQDALQKEIENKEIHLKLSDSLFKPHVYWSKTNNGYIRDFDFDGIYIPFKVVDNRVYCIHYFDSFKKKVMLTMKTENEGENDNSYINCDAMMKEALHVQQEIGIEYYFGKLNNAVKNYITALRILLEKKYITQEDYVKLCEDIGFIED